MTGQATMESARVEIPLPERPADLANEWNQHEHVCPAVELEAQRLIDHAGSPDLAKQAIDAASQHQIEQHSPADDFAQQLGYPSRVQLLAASAQLMAQDGTPWWVTEVREEGWVVWNDQSLSEAQQFSSLEALNQFVCQNAGISPC